MGSDLGRRRSRSINCKALLYFGVGPFVGGLLLILVFFRHADIARRLKLVSGYPLQDGVNCTALRQASLEAGCKLPCAANLSSEQALVSSIDGVHTQNDTTEDNISTLPPSLPKRDSLESVFLFTGILSGRGYRHRRLAVREAWANKAQIQGMSVCRFILSEDEKTPQVQKEVDTHGDIVFVKEKTNYKSILFKTYYVLEYAVHHYNVRFVLKTDDDAFVNVGSLIEQLKLLCISQDCLSERMYLGRMAKDSEVLLQPGHKWNNLVFHNHTGLRTYPNYMMGGGYVVSGDVARMLVDINLRMKLKFTPIEDATLGFWLMSMDLRHLDHPKFFTWAAPCCFKAPVRREGQRIVTRFQLSDEMEADLCSDDPWLILHKIDSPTKMRYIGNRVAACEPRTEPKVAPSIATYVQQVMEEAKLEDTASQ